MPSRPPLTATEHWHCLVLAILMGLIFTWRAFMLEPAMIAGTLDTLTTWLGQQRHELVASQKVDVSLTNVAKGIWATTWIGLPLLLMQYLGHSLRTGRWLTPSTLWLWTAIYGLCSLLASAHLLYLLLPLPMDPTPEHRLALFYSGEILLGLLIIGFALRAWWQHRREEEAARAAEAEPTM